MGRRTRLDGCRKSRPHRDFFFIFSCTVFILQPFLFVCLECPAYYLFVFTVQHTTKTFMPQAGFEPVTPASDQSQTLTLVHSATGIGRIRSPDHPARSKSLYRLSYLGPRTGNTMIQILNRQRQENLIVMNPVLRTKHVPQTPDDEDG